MSVHNRHVLYFDGVGNSTGGGTVCMQAVAIAVNYDRFH